jgi:hypothetical protein
MNYQVECSIKTANTDISCEIEISEYSRKEKTFQTDWEKLGGRLNLGADYGKWFYYQPAGEKMGIVLFPHKEGDNFYKRDRIVTLNNVPEYFVSNIGCGIDFNGEGLFHLTGETVYWNIYFSCI